MLVGVKQGESFFRLSSHESRDFATLPFAPAPSLEQTHALGISLLTLFFERRKKIFILFRGLGALQGFLFLFVNIKK